MGHNEIIFYGKNSVQEIIKSKRFKIKNIFAVSQNLIKDIPGKIPFKIVSKDSLNQLTKTNHHQNIAIKVETYPYTDFNQLNFIEIEKSKQLFVIFDSIQDPQNFGAALRNCFCFGVTGIIIQKKNTVKITPTVMKTSAGAAAHLKIYQVVNLSRVIENFKENFIKVYSLDLSGKNYINKINFELPSVLIIGSEDKGIRHQLLKKSDSIIKIPMTETFNSLNLSNSSAVALYEIYRNNF